MAPEQIRAGAVDARADIFSFGAVAYELLTGARAFAGETAADLIAAVLTADPPDLPAALPAAVRQIVQRCLEKQPEQRFQSARDLAFALRQAGGRRRCRARRPIADTFRRMATEGGGWRMQASDELVDKWGLEEGSPARRFVEARLCDFTIRCFEQPLEAATRAAATLSRTYIASVKGDYPARVVFEPFGARARREGWGYHELPTGHDCQAEMPDALSDLLLQAAAYSP